MLTNFLILVNFEGGSSKFLRLSLGLLVAFAGLSLQFLYKPFRRETDDALSCVAQLLLVCFFITGNLIKLCDPETIDDMLNVRSTNSCVALVGVDSAYAITVLMICAAAGMLVVPFAVFVLHMRQAAALETLRVKGINKPPELLLEEGHQYQLFLSHSAPLPVESRCLHSLTRPRHSPKAF